MENQQAFVNASAQIIPVLIVALLADPNQRLQRPGRSTMVLLALAAGVLGEVYALIAVYQGSDGQTLIISVTMGLITLAILWPHLRQHSSIITERVPMLTWNMLMKIILMLGTGPSALLIAWGLFPYWWAVATVMIVWLFVCYRQMRGIQVMRNFYRDNAELLNVKVYTVDELRALDEFMLEQLAVDMGIELEALDPKAAERRARARNTAPPPNDQPSA